MRWMRAMVLGMSLLGASTTWASAQNLVSVQWDADDRQAYREGYRQGRWDAQHGRRSDWDENCRWREGDDRRAFRDGYQRGYREVGNYSDGRAYADSARRIGYDDGFNDGQRDRRTGHSFRPTHSDRYEDADRGYNRGFGDKGYYKQLYRDGYRQGYERGYGQGWR